MNLIENNCSMAIILLDKLTSERNIGSFISKNIFDALADYYDNALKVITNDVEEQENPDTFNWLAYLN